jgi:hypothetical protein
MITAQRSGSRSGWRHLDGYLVAGYNEGTMPKLHRFELRREGFAEKAVPKISSAIARRLR